MKRYQNRINRFSTTLNICVIATGMMLASTAIADTNTTSTTQSATSPNIEIITVTYRNAFDYALYQQTTEMLANFNRDLEQKIVFEARNQSQDMASEFGVFTVQTAPKLILSQDAINSLAKVRVLSQPD
ncbi:MULTISPECIES: hypothetical protein [Shewanella]|uniref:Uncharacterized protein n=1 Tax=Shewanella holmiensis TaxID=2952222 RepID=A0A9X2WKT9_9GAMM|nr:MULTISPECIES: hypothetical protein [Shewanella]MCT7940979.1 hypothetical protein [Shewanella holmiensis]MDP5146232.1 hypothetical protein [Shewanella sp. ULN5]